jgi:hypothetical protein
MDSPMDLMPEDRVLVQPLGVYGKIGPVARRR